jgi:cation diffusion facilitator family transporter
MKQSRKKPTDLHPFGYARESYFWAFMVAVLLFTVGGFFSVYRGFQKFLNPGESIEAWGLAYFVLGISMVFEAFAFFKALNLIQKKRKNMSLYLFLKHCKEPELLVVFLEDLLAEIGLFIALIGVGLSHITGSPLYDALATIVIGVLLCSMAVFLTLEVRSLLLGERASQLDEYKIRRAIRETNTVEEILTLSTQHLGPEEIMVAMNCRFPDYYNSHEIAAAIDLIDRKIRDCLPHAKQIFIEPELGLKF